MSLSNRVTTLRTFQSHSNLGQRIMLNTQPVETSTTPTKAGSNELDARIQFHVDLLRASHARTVESVIETGKRLRSAQTELGVHAFKAMFSDDRPNDARPPFGYRTAMGLMAVAEHPVISNENMHGSLPTSWSVLEELTRVPVPLLTEAIEQKRIHPEISKTEIRKLKSDLREKPEVEIDHYPEPPEPTERSADDQEYAEAVAHIIAFLTYTSVDTIFAPTRSSPKDAWARQLTYYFLHTHLGWAQARVADAFTRDKSSIAHGVEQVERQRSHEMFDGWMDRMFAIIEAARNLREESNQLFEEATALAKAERMEEEEADAFHENYDPDEDINLDDDEDPAAEIAA